MSPRFDLDGLNVDDPRLVPAIEMVGRTGAEEIQIRCSEEESPAIWIASARWGGHWETASAFDPLNAVFRLCDAVMDGGTCTHCHRPTGFVEDFAPMPLPELVCWYQWDPELETFRRGCEGHT